MENLVAATLHSLAILADLRLFHWRDGRAEVDLVLDHPTHPLAFEVASSIGHSRDGLRALMARHPRFENQCYLVTPRARTMHPRDSSTGVGTLPLDLFLVACGRQAEAALASRLHVSSK
jgi:predicted AAA+ superfamily ATPase